MWCPTNSKWVKGPYIYYIIHYTLLIVIKSNLRFCKTMLNLNGRAICSRTVSFCRYIMIMLGGTFLSLYMNSTWYCQKCLFLPQFDPESLHMCTKLSGRAAQFSRKEKFDEIVHFLSARWQSFQYRLWFRCREHLKMGECISEVKDQKALLLRVSFRLLSRVTKILPRHGLQMTIMQLKENGQIGTRKR